MKLKKKSITNNNILSTINKNQTIHLNKNKKININSTKNKNKNIYVNKILKESLGKTHPENEINENFPNFHSNIRNILSNEENREKAIKYIVDMRKKQRKLSPSFPKSNYLEIYNKNDNFNNKLNSLYYKTSNEGFYSTKSRRKKNKLDQLIFQDNNSIDYSFNNCTIIDNNNYNNKRYKKNNKLKNIKNNYQVITPSTPYIGSYLSPNKVDLIMPEKIIRVNKNNKNIVKIPYLSEARNIYEKNGMTRANTYRVLPNYSYKKIINSSNNINVKRNTVNYPQNQRSHNKKILFEDNYDNIYKINNNPIDNPHLNNYYDSYNEEDENEEYNYNYMNNNQNIEYVDGSKDNNDSDDNTSNDNNSQLKEVVVDNINEIYQTPEYEEYYSNIKIKNENNSIHNQHKNLINKRNKLVFNKKNKKIGKYNSFYTRKNNLSLNFSNLQVEKNRITIKMNRNNTSNNISKISSINNESISKDNYINPINSYRKDIKEKYGLKDKNLKISDDHLDYDNMKFKEGNNSVKEENSYKSKENEIENDNMSNKEINEKNALYSNKIKLKVKPVDKTKREKDYNKKNISEKNSNNNQYNILKDENENNKNIKKENINNDKNLIYNKEKQNIIKKKKKFNLS